MAPRLARSVLPPLPTANAPLVCGGVPVFIAGCCGQWQSVPLLPLRQRGAEGVQVHLAVLAGGDAQAAGHVAGQLTDLGALGVHGAKAAADGGADALIEGPAVVRVLEHLVEGSLFGGLGALCGVGIFFHGDLPFP